MTFLGARAFIPESVQLMRRMIPKMKSLVIRLIGILIMTSNFLN